MQRQRFELKFRVDEPTARAIGDAVNRRLEPDPFGQDQADGAYPIHSLYLDSPQLSLFQATVNGDRNRFKLRLRFYNDDPTSPVFLETKRRANDCILKERVAVHRDRIGPMLSTSFPTLTDLLRPTATQLETAHSFCRQMDRLRARPVAHVAYRRQAWFALGENPARVTIDYGTVCAIHDSFDISTQMVRPVSAFSPGEVIVEFKYTERFPVWLSDIARDHGLVRTSAAKYVDGLTHSRTRRSSAPHLVSV
ncbi:MAG: polyphosphate polymerase domain-containing protein [Synoicihabitans sp.]